MKDESLTAECGPWLAVTADQVDSRRRLDAVPAALEALATLDAGLRLAPERTAGDEIQLLTDSASVAVEVVLRLSRLGRWRVGLGLGGVQVPLPASTRAARGSAYIAARQAVDAARRRATGIALVAAPDPGDGTAPAQPGATPGKHVSANPYRDVHTSQQTATAPPPACDSPTPVDPDRGGRHGGPDPDGHDAVWRADAALVMLRSLLARRTREGWQAMDLADAGLANHEIAARLGISPSAASQRLARAQRDESDLARTLCVDLLDEALRARRLPPEPAGRPGACGAAMGDAAVGDIRA